MPKFAFTGRSEQIFLYPHAFIAEPGEVYERDENPDPYWFDQVDDKPTPYPRAEEE